MPPIKKPKKRKPTKRTTRGSKVNTKKKPRKSAPKRKKKKQKKSLLLRLFRFATMCAIWASIAGFLLLIYCLHDLPDTEKLTKNVGNYQIKVISVDGEIITTLGNLYGEDLKYKDIPPHLINAVLATEDRRFYYHYGFDIYGFARAMFANIKAGQIVQGGSTITQQLAKIVFLSPERTIKRKIQELMLALWLEYRYSKEQIITMYMNRVYMGAGYFGVAAAAQGYFGKQTNKLTLSEAALIAGLLKAPSRYSPFSNKELAKKRATQVLVNMVDAGYISVAEAIDVDTTIRTRTKITSSRFYFTDWLAGQIPDYIGIIDSNLEIHTTIDLRLQKYAEDSINEVLKIQGEARNANQAAVVVLSPRGEVLALVGGKNYSQSQFNRATQGQRQPGSSFKFFVYLAALEAGYLPTDLIEDKEIEIDGWAPKNYDDEYRGQVVLKNAFAHSINSVAVQLSESVDRRRVIQKAKQLGISSNLKALPSIALGTSEVNLLEMTQAYAHLPNEGYRLRAYGIKEIKTSEGATIYKRHGGHGGRVLSKKIVAKMNELMKHVMEEGTGRRSKLLRQTAGKTGTTQDFRDAWFIGYTPQIVTGVWVGNDDNSPMDGVTGGSLAGQIWKKFMTKTHQNINPLAIPTKTGFFGWFQWADDADDAERRTFWDNIMDSIENKE